MPFFFYCVGTDFMGENGRNCTKWEKMGEKKARKTHGKRIDNAKGECAEKPYFMGKNKENALFMGIF